MQENDKLNINTNRINPLENEIIFKSIQNNGIKILFLLKNSIIIVGAFPITSSIQFQRLLLIHIFIALVNFKGDFLQFSEKIDLLINFEENNFMDLQNLYIENVNQNNEINNEINNMLEILIFQNFFLKSLVLHFRNVFNEMFKKEDLNLKQTKLANLYIIDINTSSCILDMSKLQGFKTSKKNRKFYKLENLYQELIYHSRHMYNEYIRENDMKYTANDLDFRFVKFECTSTYPRLLFIIKFIPVLKGMAIIHIYRQKKLSRNNENNMLIEQGLNFKEVDLLFGSFIRENPNFEFKYGAPKKLEHIEKFLEEFFITNRNGLGIFSLYNSDKKYLYVNYDIINIINSFNIGDNANVDKIFNDINKKIEENFDKQQNSINKEDTESNLEDSKDIKKLNNLFSLNKDKYYKYFLNKEKNNNNTSNVINTEKNYKKIKKININLSNHMLKRQNNSVNKLIGINSNNTKSLNNKNNMDIINVNNNINISELISNNSERKNLIKNNETLSLFQTQTDNKTSNKQLDNISNISDVKKSEKFEIKVINIKERERNRDRDNEEDTKEKISNNTSSKKEKEIKFNDLLDLISSNKKINQYMDNKNKIEEDFDENELTKRNIDSMKLELEHNSNISRKKTNNKLNIVNKEKKPSSENSKNSLIQNN